MWSRYGATAAEGPCAVFYGTRAGKGTTTFSGSLDSGTCAYVMDYGKKVYGDTGNMAANSRASRAW